MMNGSSDSFFRSYVFAENSYSRRKTKSEEERISGKARGEENMKTYEDHHNKEIFHAHEEKRKHGKAFCATRKHFDLN
jgi:hypothetical protein